MGLSIPALLLSIQTTEIGAFRFAYEPDLHQYVAKSVRTCAADSGGTLMKKVVSIGLGVLLAVLLAFPATADEASSLAGVLEELYSMIAVWVEDEIVAEAVESSESTLSATGGVMNSLAGTPSGPGVTTEMTPMTLPGG